MMICENVPSPQKKGVGRKLRISEKRKLVERKKFEKRIKAQSESVQIFVLLTSKNIQLACCNHSVTFGNTKENFHVLEKRKKEISKSESSQVFSDIDLDQWLQRCISSKRELEYIQHQSETVTSGFRKTSDCTSSDLFWHFGALQISILASKQ